MRAPENTSIEPGVPIPDWLIAASQPGCELTFIAADPPRQSWFGLWSDDNISRSTEVVDLIRPRPGLMPIGEAEAAEAEGRTGPSPAITRIPTPVRRIDIADAIDGLLIDRSGIEGFEHSSPSLDAWAAVVRSALALTSRGRVRPGLSPSGIDTWRVGGLTPDELHHVDRLVAALPPAAHCTPNFEADLSADADEVVRRIRNADKAGAAGNGDGSALEFRHRITSGQEAVAQAIDAVADRFLRSEGAAIEAGHRGFAAIEPTTIDARTALLRLEALSGDRPPLITLRVTPPDLPEGDFTAVVAFVSRRDPDVSVKAETLWSAPDEVRSRFRTAEHTLLLTLRRAARIWAPLQPLLDQPLPNQIELSEFDLNDLSGRVANELGAAGLSIMWPIGLIGGIDLRPVVASAIDAPEIPVSGRTRKLDLASLLELRWEGEVNGEVLTAEELKELIDAKRSVIRLRGQWVRVDDEQRKRLTERRNVGAGTALSVALGGSVTIDGTEHEVQVEGPLAALGDRLSRRDPLRRLEPPEKLHAELRPYQERGLAWLVEMDELGLGGVLADDMGLGKTVQMLGLHVHRQEAEPSHTLVVCPTSVVGNWERETNRFAPDTPVVRYHGAERSLDGLAPGTILLTSYGIARRDASRLAKVPWGLMVADEAQTIKNPASRTARALRTIPAETRFALTGTPVQNQLTDLWAILDWTTPGLLGPLERFRRDLANPIEREGDAEVAQQLNRLLRPFLLRRRKSDSDIAPDLPPKTETDEIVPLTAEQATLYQAVVTQVMAEIAAATGIERRGLVLRLLTRLKQVCNHPVHLLGDDDDQDGVLPGRSGKLTATTDLLDVITQEGEAALIFTQYVQMGRLLERHLGSKGYRTRFLHGGLSLGKREEMVAEFQAGEADVFVVSLKAGGTGLNLTAATHVIHYDRWWNPAVEDQASDRAWRIGQDRPVQIHRLICEGTIEDRIAVLLNEKRAVADAVVGAGEGWISELSDTELAELVALSDGDESANAA